MKKYQVVIEGIYSSVAGESLDETATVDEFETFADALERYGSALVECTRPSYVLVNGWKVTDGFIKLQEVGENYVSTHVCNAFTCDMSYACPSFGSY